ncbi:MAG: hypothetical protein SynsKO_16840 [Synoicihabitans sp.]
MNEEIQGLFRKYEDGSITADEVRELENGLRADEALREEFLEHLNVGIAIEQHPDYPLYDVATPEAFRGFGRRKRFFWRRLSSVHWIAAASVAVLLFFGIAAISNPAKSVSAVVLRNDEAVWEGETLDVELGREIVLNEIDLTAGWLRLELPKGVIFDIYGPARGRFLSSERFQLDAGRLNVDVGPSGKGFTVVTKHAEIVDLGTQFGVDVDRDSKAKVAVFSGEVEVYPREDSGPPQLLEEGEGLQLDSAERTSRLMSVNVADEQRPHRMLSGLEHDFKIRDNLRADQSKSFYGIISGGMREGMNVYTTQKVVRWWSNAGSTFPAELSDADLVQTFHHDRDVNQLEITLDVVRDSVVYVFFDSRYETPAWLPERLVDTGHVLRSGPWRPSLVVRDIEPDQSGEIFVHYKVWRTVVQANQSITLGASVNRNRGKEETSRVMYGIAVKSL